MEGSRGQYRFSFLLKNSGADAADVSFDAGCSIPGAQILPDQESPSVIPALSSFAYSGVLTLPEHSSDREKLKLTLDAACSGKTADSFLFHFQAETSVHAMENGGWRN